MFSFSSQTILEETSTNPFVARDLRGRRIAGFPVSASYTPNTTDLRNNHLDATFNQKRVFRDHIVDAETGRPVRQLLFLTKGFSKYFIDFTLQCCQITLTPEEKKRFDASELNDKADEQAFYDWFGDADNYVSSQ